MSVLFQKLTAPRAIVLENDPALARPKRADFPDGEDGSKLFWGAALAFDATWAEYEKTFDVTRLPIVTGCKPAVFMIRSLTAQQLAHVEDKMLQRAGVMHLGSAELETVAYGVVGLRDVQVDIDGVITDVVCRRIKGDLGERLADDVLAIVAGVDSIRRELWARITACSHLSPEASKSNP